MLNSELKGKIAQTEDTLMSIGKRYGKESVFTTSFGAEDMVITDIIKSLDMDIEVATIDTGRFHQETYEFIDMVVQFYGLSLKTYFPESREVESMINRKGLNLFYYSTENRKMCCNVRKVGPLNRILEGRKAWITGLRAEQSKFRQKMQRIEEDPVRGIVKANPLINWKSSDVWAYIRDKGVPYNRLHDKGYPSIGCEPCTRAILPGEDERAGRWWWESDVKECGLHLSSQEISNIHLKGVR